MVSKKIKELAAARAKIAALEKSIQSQLQVELAGLPATYGFASAAEFAKAVQAAGGGRRGRRRKVRKGGVRGVKRQAKPARKRAVITDEVRQLVKKLVEAGKTGREIAKASGISLPSVQNVKKALGLVKKR